jgi:hypothetical protein
MGTGGSFPWGKAAGAWSWPLIFEVKIGVHIIPLPTYLHGVVLNELSTGTTLSLPFTIINLWPAIYLFLFNKTRVKFKHNLIKMYKPVSQISWIKKSYNSGVSNLQPTIRLPQTHDQENINWTEQDGSAVNFPTNVYIWEVSGSNLGRDTYYPLLNVRSFPQSLLANFRIASEIPSTLFKIRHINITMSNTGITNQLMLLVCPRTTERSLPSSEQNSTLSLRISHILKAKDLTK